ncbi:unnamed protein product [Meloidogyne enterolobii]|uniref:Uncharacterized protein n=1 Tax=Meloidogyne enterolobii TaxID=390850 RepID=A0ACB0ZPW4_MELEN
MCWISSNVPFFSTNNSSSCRRAFYINRANNGTINSTSSVAFSARSMERGNSGEGSPSICEVVNSSPNASVRVMFRQRSRRFFCSSEDPLIRLPTDVIPIHYELHLKIYLPYKNGIDYVDRNFTFDGNLRLHLLCRQTTNVLLLHSKSLEIDYDKATIWMGGGTTRLEGPRIIGWKELAGRNDLLEMRLDRALLPGRNYILLGYKAKIGKNSQEGGLYQSHYLNGANGENRYIAATQMQPLDARKMLPCFDEPSFKAEFSISVQHPDGTVALSNAPIEHTRNVERGWTLSLFEKTPKMATYLLALVISDFQYREASYNKIKIRVWSQASKLDYTSHALEVSVRSLKYFEDYFGIKYPLKKLDIFGVPALRVAAMENWGLIICRQQNLLYIEGVQARRDKQFVTDVLAHEIAHMARFKYLKNNFKIQWFGDLVTMEWWDDLWLNEGFATIMGMKAADYAENSTSRTSQLFYEHTVKAFRFDQVAHQAHALSYKISSVREVARRFDRITYLKAAAVLRMVEHTVGENIFREGLRSFLRNYKFKNARSDDLIRVLRHKYIYYLFFTILLKILVLSKLTEKAVFFQLLIFH